MPDAANQGRTLLVVEPSSAGVLIPRAARQLGYRVAVVSFDHPGDDRVLCDEVRENTDHIIVVDTNDHALTLKAVVAFHEQYPVSGVVPGFEFYVPLAAQISAELGLPHLPHPCWLRNKLQMLEQVRRAGERVPRFGLAQSRTELARTVEQVGVPCVIKPVDSAGSIHVRRVETIAEARAAYDEFSMDERLDFGLRTNTDTLVTEYLDGAEYSVEGIVTGHDVSVASITEKLLGPEPYFVELGHIVEAGLSAAIRSVIERYVRSIIHATQLTVGAFHCELRLVDKEPVLIEIGARLPGDHIVDLVEYVTGVWLPRAVAAAHMGDRLSARAAMSAPAALSALGAPVRASHAGVRFFTAPVGMATYSRIRGLDRVRRHPGVLRVHIDRPPGEPIPPGTDFRCRMGHVVFVADSYRSAVRTWSVLGELISFE